LDDAVGIVKIIHILICPYDGRHRRDVETEPGMISSAILDLTSIVASYSIPPTVAMIAWISQSGFLLVDAEIWKKRATKLSLSTHISRLNMAMRTNECFQIIHTMK